MTDKPTTAGGYPPELAVEAKRMCLYVATILGDLLDDVVVVGGLVPYLLVDQATAPAEGRHVGTRDLDLGLALALLNEERYREIARRLRDRGFRQATNDKGSLTRQTWVLAEAMVSLDFLIPPVVEGQRPGSLQPLEADFAAIVMPALPLAFLDTVSVVLDDVTPAGERARRKVRVAGPAAFVAMKAHAFRIRGANKDAYDLVYLLTNHGDEPVTGVARAFNSLAEHPEAQQALDFLAEDFASVDHVGPQRHAEFLGNRDDDVFRQDAVGVVQAFLAAVRDGSR
ncbi:MAG: nucleotidyl transferase AbiEii/AbiGii toxin family protein [Synechococcus sp.]|nr:nucleotidyl transferase AbiEii/AbiGii toxin family protein [Synechococcus sp.]